MALNVGDRLGPYEIIARIGVGGMGEVYRARDPRLHRDVAVKILPPEVAGDPARRQRFNLEARAVAALNHPNIVAIHDVGDTYIVTEFVDGESLRHMKLGLRKILDIAVQIADGMAAAHAAGITHRDLKPTNIMLTRDGRVKILDFGVAKMATHSATAATNAESDTVTSATEPGLVMGTVAYMSPEQVRGRTVDHRSDIFSFGLILYELVAGARAFRGETSVELMTMILRQDAPELPDTVPPGVRQIVTHCLEKDPGNRFQSAKDLAFALSQFESTSLTSATQAVKVRTRRKIAAPAAVLAAITLAFVAGHALWLAPRAPQWSGVRLGGPEMALNPRVSPDGHLLALQAMDRGLTQVAVMKPESANWSLLTHRRDRGGVVVISWSPDGALIYYDRLTDVPSGVYSIPVLGGEEHLVLASAFSPEALSDGSLLLQRLNRQGQPQWHRFWPQTGRLLELPLIAQQATGYNETARAAPGGKLAVLEAYGWQEKHQALFALDLASNTTRRITPGDRNDEAIVGLGISRDGKSILTVRRAGALRRAVAIPVDGGPERVLFTLSSDAWYLEGGLDGAVYASLVERPAELVRLSLSGKAPETVAWSAQVEGREAIMLLPDGRVLAPGGTGRARLMAFEPGRDPVPFINTVEETGAPMSQAGSGQIVCALGPGQDAIAVVELESGRIANRIAPGKGPIQSLSATPDGKTIFFAAHDKIWRIPASGGEAKEVCSGNSAVMEPSGRSLVVMRAEASRLRLLRVPPDGGPEHEIPVDRSIPVKLFPLSSGAMDASGRLLLMGQPFDSWFNPLLVLDTATGRLTRVPSNDLSDHLSAAWLPDGRIVALRMGLRAALWKLTPEGQ